ncbi:hypothetical protein HMPREF1121_01389 [Porphyromonas sp. KLE 1280]|uniref:DEAD/DEAH box helicase n=1 Tax=Porphyromonas sp. KLE 1280 TaxID=997829 RepID=UPI0004D66EA1|nr:DEAD/DEAH box helicase [Porphyromonas sp. KLE 1280]KDU78535.1 hypothetical protein HMPREF1121_01389 [Porphyromonas sp. KLE 1280]
MIDVFDNCKQINDLLFQGKEQEARDALIILLQELKDNQIEYTPLVNHLIREVGLYLYIDTTTSDWQERIVFEAFKVDAGCGDEITLHREQSAVLSALLKGEDLAISAPTSFGKSFIIDAFVAMKQPNNVVIIVPTLALTDETRRRLYRKFGKDYKVITTTGEELGEKNLFVFPQERALMYVDEIAHIDLLIVDEFYKAGTMHGNINALDGRATQLIEAISLLGRKASQKYFLAPNISELKGSSLTSGMRFMKVDFNTVYTHVEKTYDSISGDKKEKETQKFAHLKRILETVEGKSLIYVNSHSSLQKVTEKILEFDIDMKTCGFLGLFSLWLKEHYEKSYVLAHLVRRGVGIHSGRLHRALAQIQIKLFEQEGGLKNLVSTSSLIEGVNTSARNVIVWSNKNSNTKYDYFTYKNIVGRSGRMFKHFVGEVYLLEAPPQETFPCLELDYPDVLLERIDPQDYSGQLTSEQIARIKQNEEEMDAILGQGEYRKIMKEIASYGVSKAVLEDIIEEMKGHTGEWNSKLRGLLDSNPKRWGNPLYLMMPLLRKVKHFKRRDKAIVHFIQALSRSWTQSIPEILGKVAVDGIKIEIEEYFDLERMVSFDFISLLHSINAVAKRVLPSNVDISPFIAKASNAFLPPLVFVLEEFGLPRMLSRKIQNTGILDLERNDISIDEVLDEFKLIGEKKIIEIADLSEVDQFILSNFFEGITSTP